MESDGPLNKARAATECRMPDWERQEGRNAGGVRGGYHIAGDSGRGRIIALCVSILLTTGMLSGCLVYPPLPRVVYVQPNCRSYGRVVRCSAYVQRRVVYVQPRVIYVQPGVRYIPLAPPPWASAPRYIPPVSPSTGYGRPPVPSQPPVTRPYSPAAPPATASVLPDSAQLPPAQADSIRAAEVVIKHIAEDKALELAKEKLEAKRSRRGRR